jgi:uncharacterized protein (TIGR03067 family)
MAGATLLTLAIFLAARPAPAAVDMAKLVGVWKVVGAEMPYGPVSEEDMKVIDVDQVVFSKTQVTFKKAGERDDRGRFTIDPTKDPKQMDVVPDDDSHKGKTMRWIYLLEKDSLKLGYDMEDPGKRPKDFTTNLDRDTVVLILKRCKR